MRVSTRTIGAAYLVVGAGSGVGAVLGGGVTAVVWAATCGAMGLAWAADPDVTVRADRLRLPRRLSRPFGGHRDVPFTDIDHLATPHPLGRTPHPRAELRGGRSVLLPGLSSDALAELAVLAGVPVVADPRPNPIAAAPVAPMDVAREAAALRARDVALRAQLAGVVRRRDGGSAVR